MRFDYILRTEGTVLQFRGNWTLGANYAVGNAVRNGTASYWCKLQHLAAAGNEPGVGAQQATCWEVLTISVGAGGITLHSLLSGLAADDHPQYLKADGSRALSAALILAQIATPDAPALGYTVLYGKSDGKIYKRPTGGAEAEVGGSTDGWIEAPAMTYASANSMTCSGDYSAILVHHNISFATLYSACSALTLHRFL